MHSHFHVKPNRCVVLRLGLGLGLDYNNNNIYNKCFSCPNTRNLEVVDTATYNLEKWKINRIIPVGWRKTGKLIKGLLKAG